MHITENNDELIFGYIVIPNKTHLMSLSFKKTHNISNSQSEISPRSYRIRLALFNEIKILTRLSKSKYVVKLLEFEHNTVSIRRFQHFRMN